MENTEVEGHHHKPGEGLKIFSEIDPVFKWLKHNRDFLAEGKPESLTDVQIKRLLDQELPEDELRVPADHQMESAFVKAIHAILRKRVLMKWGYETAYLSVMIFLRYVSKNHVSMPRTMKLVAVACLSLAVRLENPDISVEECCIEGKACDSCMYVTDDDYIFETLVIEEKAEELVRTFGCQMLLVTPFHFVPFLVKEFTQAPAADRAHNVERINDIIFSLVSNMNIMCRKSSVIALAAMLRFTDGELKKTKDQMVARAKPAAEALGISNVEEVLEVFHIMDIKVQRIPELSIDITWLQGEALLEWLNGY